MHLIQSIYKSKSIFWFWSKLKCQESAQLQYILLCISGGSKLRHMNSMVHRVPYSEFLDANNLDRFWVVKLNIKEYEIVHRIIRRPEVTDSRLNFQEHYPQTKINKMIFLPAKWELIVEPVHITHF